MVLLHTENPSSYSKWLAIQFSETDPIGGLAAAPTVSTARTVEGCCLYRVRFYSSMTFEDFSNVTVRPCPTS